MEKKRGRCGTMTHDYKRHGTTTLFAALDLVRGRVVGECHPRHRQQEFLKFLRRLDREYPKGMDLHLVLDNYSTHKTAAVKAWLAKHPRVEVHNRNPRPYQWTAPVRDILTKVAECHAALATDH